MFTLKNNKGVVLKTSPDLEKIQQYAKNYLKENKENLIVYNDDGEKISEFKILNG